MTFKASDWHFANTRALFDAARDATREYDRCRRQVERLESSEGVRAQGYDATGHGSVPGDPMRATDRRMDFERSIRDTIETDNEMMDYAFDVLYGSDRESGAAALVGRFAADVVWWHWLADLKWDATADMLGKSSRACQDAARRLFRAVDEARGDSDGFEPVIGGQAGSV